MRDFQGNFNLPPGLLAVNYLCVHTPDSLLSRQYVVTQRLCRTQQRFQFIRRQAALRVDIYGIVLHNFLTRWMCCFVVRPGVVVSAGAFLFLHLPLRQLACRPESHRLARNRAVAKPPGFAVLLMPAQAFDAARRLHQCRTEYVSSAAKPSMLARCFFRCFSLHAGQR